MRQLLLATVLAVLIVLLAPILPTTERPDFVRYVDGATSPAKLGWDQYQGCYYNSLQSPLRMIFGIGIDIRLNTPNSICPS